MSTRLDDLTPNHRRDVIRLVLSNPYLRGSRTFAAAVALILGRHVPEGEGRRLRSEVYALSGIQSAHRGPSALLVPAGSHKLLRDAVAVAYGDVAGARTAPAAIVLDGSIVFLGGPKDPEEGQRGYMTPRGWVTEGAALEPEEEPAAEPAAEEPMTMETLIPLVVRAMRERGYRHLEIHDEGLGGQHADVPTYTFRGSGEVGL
jgi:hypothetical protein